MNKCAITGDKIVLECISLYVLHVVWCLFLSVLLLQVQQCRTQLLQQKILCMKASKGIRMVIQGLTSMWLLLGDGFDRMA